MGFRLLDLLSCGVSSYEKYNS